MIGITIDDVVTRYRFELNAFKQDNGTTPTEVYYSEYIADAIDLPLTTYVLTKEVNEWTHLRFDWTTPYDFVTPLVDNIRLKIEFLGLGGWAANLGYEADKIYKDFPCMFSENRLSSPRANNVNVKCDLYTYLDGPHSSLTTATSSTSKGPYIMVYNFENGLPINNNVRFEIGRLLIGSAVNSDTKIRFSIIEETPDMLTKYIELYFTEFSAFTTVSQSAPTASVDQTIPSLDNSQISITDDHRYSLSTGSNGFAIIYEYDTSSTQSFATDFFNCSTGNHECVALGYPVNWIIEYHPSNSFSTTISSSFSRTNGVYAGNFAGMVRVFNSDSLTIKKSSYTIDYTYQALDGGQTQFTRTETVYKASETYFNVRFRPLSAIPANGFVRFTFASGVELGNEPYCSTTMAAYDTQLGVQCIN